MLTRQHTTFAAHVLLLRLRAANVHHEGSLAMKPRVLASIMCVAAATMSWSCGGGESGQAATAAAPSVKLQGAGASFPAPLYTKWFKTYSAAHPGVLVDYQSVGSGSGVKSVIDH